MNAPRHCHNPAIFHSAPVPHSAIAMARETGLVAKNPSTTTSCEKGGSAFFWPARVPKFDSILQHLRPESATSVALTL
jgi:hypothetical protein